MAIRRVKGFPPGIFQGDVSSKFLCGSCHFVLRNPVQLYCGHRFCKNCVEIEKPETNNVRIQCQCCIDEETDDEIYTIDADQVQTVFIFQYILYAVTMHQSEIRALFFHHKANSKLKYIVLKFRSELMVSTFERPCCIGG